MSLPKCLIFSIGHLDLQIKVKFPVSGDLNNSGSINAKKIY